MTMTMRERLCVAAVKQEFKRSGRPLPGVAFEFIEAVTAAVDTYGDVVDAILAELREPSVEMRHVCTFEVAETVFPAMIDAARAK